MGALWTPIGFETGDLSECAASSGALSVVAGAAYAGSYGLRITDFSVNNYVEMFPSGNILYGAARIRIGSDVVLPAYNSVALLNQKISGIWRNISISVDRPTGSAGAPTAWNFNGNDYTTNFSLDTWHLLELLTDVTNSIITARIDGTELYSGDGGFSWSGASGFERAQLGTPLGTATSGTIDFDDWLGDDAQWPGGGGVSAEQTESLSLYEEMSASKATSVIVGESIALSDVVASSKLTASAMSELLALSESSSARKLTSSSISESLSLSDVLSTGRKTYASCVEFLELSDVTAAAAFRVASITESISLSDLLSVISADAALVAESFGLSDIVSATVVARAEIAESLGLSDSPGASKAMSAEISETIALTDITSFVDSAISAISESLALSDEYVAKSRPQVLSVRFTYSPIDPEPDPITGDLIDIVYEY